MSFSFFPKTVFKTQSKISGEIVVKEQFGRYTLHVQNLIQSGGIIKAIWQKPLKRIAKAEKVLVLGLGGGTVVHLIKSRYPEAKIISLEIDPIIIKVGKKYFGLEEIKDLEIINQDAVKWVKEDKGEKFDLILVDLYFGREISQKVMEDQFLKKLRQLLEKDGVIIFNWLKNKSEEKLFEKLEKNFVQIKKVDTSTNLFLFCY